MLREHWAVLLDVRRDLDPPKALKGLQAFRGLIELKPVNALIPPSTTR
jgi:hypothetical protein